MGWQDAPLVEKKPAWASAPLASASVPSGTPAEISAAGKDMSADFFDMPQWIQALKNVGEAGKQMVSGLGATALGAGSGYIGEPIRYAASVAGNKLGLSGEPAPFDPHGVMENIQREYTTQPSDASGRELTETIGAIPAGAKKILTSGASGLGFAAGNLSSPEMGDRLAKAAGEATGDVIDVGASILPLKGARLGAVPGIVSEAAPASFVSRTIPRTRAVTQDMTPEQAHAAAVETLLAHDIPLSTANRGGKLSGVASGLGRTADTLLGASDFVTKQLRAFTTAILKKAGINATRATPDAMASLQGKVNAKYNDLHERVPTKIDQQAMNELMAAREEILGEVPPSEQAPLLKKIDDITGMMQAGKPVTITGRAAQNLRTSLVRMGQSANSTVKHAAGQLKEILDDAFERGASKEDAAKMQDVRQQFIKMKQIEDMVGDNGIITPQKAASVLARKRNRWQSKYGLGDQELPQLVQAGKEILPDKVPNSGTPTRAADMAKVVGILTNPKETLKAIGTIFGGRMLNESRAMRGTRADITAKAARPQQRGVRAAIAAGLLAPQQGQP